MAVPAHLDTSVCPYEYHQSSTITDVETGGVGIITNLRTYLVTNRGWSEPSTALFKSPTDPGGRWCDILVTRISATNIEFRVRDHLAHTIITRRFQIDAGGTAINYWAGKFFARVESLRATPECFNADLLQVSPDDETAVQFALAANAYRTSADTNDSQNTVGYNAIWVETAQAAQLGARMLIGALDLSGTAIGRANTAMASGDMMMDDAVVGVSVASENRRAGRLWHAYTVPSSIAFGTDKTIDVDDAVTATFRVVGLVTVGTERLAYRKSDP